jgi:hypothetical protein
VEPVEDVFLLKIGKLFGFRNFPTPQESTTETEQILIYDGLSHCLLAFKSR